MEKEYSSFSFKSVTTRLVFSVVNSLILDVFKATNNLTLKFLTFSIELLIIDQYNLTIVKSTALKEGCKIRIEEFPKGYDFLFNDVIQSSVINLTGVLFIKIYRVYSAISITYLVLLVLMNLVVLYQYS